MLPTLFLSHGSPMLALDDTPTTRFWQTLPEVIGEQPKGIVCVSAHWDTEITSVTGGRPEKPILHDFYGFPRPLYQQDWTLTNSDTLAQTVTDHLNSVGHKTRQEADRPIDHGTWVPLRFAWPDGAVPDVQVSVNMRADGEFHWQLGEALAPLREQGILIIGSGGITHNLRLLQRDVDDNKTTVEAAQYMSAVQSAVADHDRQQLSDWPSLPHAARFVPTPEHYYPLVVATAAAGVDKPVWLHERWTMRELDLFAVGFGVAA